MPLRDDEVAQTLDWLGRTQPVGQKQLNLATATGSAPSGGPVTGPAGGGIAPPGPGGTRAGEDTPGVTGGGASPVMQAVKVADLVRRAAGLIPGAAKAASTAPEGAFAAESIMTPGGPFPSAPPSPPPAELIMTPAGPIESVEGAQAGEQIMEAGGPGEGGSRLPGVGQALGFATSVLGAATAQQDWEKAIHGLDAALFASGAGSPVAAIDEVALGVAKLFGLGDSGPSKAWLTFGSRLGETLGLEHQALQTAADAVNAAKSPADLRAAVDQFKTTIGTKVGGFGTPEWLSQFPVQNQHVASGLDMTSPYFVPYIPGATGTAHERGRVAEFSPFVSELNQAIQARLSAFSAPTAASPPGTPPAATPPSPPPPSGSMMGVGGPAGALGFSRDVLEPA